ncbi:uncharacterized protein [Amphiura filiformis]|uniref:uncharacterized protein n=1 Tax=Amphiura filiformis TaxID=82378 RepID=UPI003B215FB3
MTDDSKLHIIEREMGRCNIPICGLAEVRWTGKGHFSLDDGHTVYYSAGSDRLKRNGVGFILSRETAKCVLGYNPISDRLITIRLQARPVNISVVQAYAPTSTADDETIDSFFHELQETINKIPNRDITIIMGISMPKLEMTWLTMMPLENGRTRNQLDYILIKRRWRSSVKVAKTYPGADCGSDHQLLVAEIRSKLKSVKRDTPPRRYDVNRINEQYRVEVRNSFQILLEQEEWTPNELWEQTKKAISTAAQNNLPKPKKTRSPWISEEVGTMADERRQVKARGILTEKDKRQDLFRAVKEITGKKTPKLDVIKDEDGEILTESDQIKQRWQQYCQGLYASKDGLGGETEPIEVDENEPDILRSEVVMAMKKMRTGKAPGYDDIPAELIKETGDEGVDVVHKLCNLLWKDKSWPIDWTRSIFLPLPKKGNTRECKNNRTISVISHASKIMLYITVERIKQHVRFPQSRPVLWKAEAQETK